MTNKIERVKSGVPGLDTAISGGFVKGRSTLVCGSYGTGKTTFCLQFLMEGAKHGENGLYITFEEDPEQIKEEAASYGWDVKKLEAENKLKVIKVAPLELINLVEAGYGQIGDLMKNMKIQRLVVDSIIPFDMVGKDDYERRKYVLDFVGWLKKHGCTALLTMECAPGELTGARFGIAESAVDGIIVLYHPQEKKKRTRALEILKMRETKHSDWMLDFKISDKGISIKK
jgi:circadian clock protein KaiC